MRLLHSVLDLVAPPVCVGCGLEGAVICANCTSVNILPYGSRCYVCARLSPSSRTCQKCARLGGPARLWIRTAYDGLAERLIEQYKFGSRRVAAKTLAGLMADFNTAELAGHVVVPVPTATGRVRERGFDHAKLLAKSLAADLRLAYWPALRHVGQARQVGSTRLARLSQAQASYVVARPWLVKGQKVLLVDDVVTTGATMQACARALRQAGAKTVDGLAFAKRL